MRLGSGIRRRPDVLRERPRHERCSRGGTIGFDLNGAKLTEPISVISTATDKDPLAWRQWHHWNKMTKIVQVTLPKGLSVLTLRVLTLGNMNFDYLEFVAE